MDTDVSHSVQKLVDELHARIDKIETHLGLDSQPEQTESTEESEHE